MNPIKLKALLDEVELVELRKLSAPREACESAPFGNHHSHFPYCIKSYFSIIFV